MSIVSKIKNTDFNLTENLTDSYEYLLRIFSKFFIELS